jgi:sulfide:quinone oxidoreductase
VDTKEVIQNNFTTLVTSAPSKPYDILVNAGLTNYDGLVDVNPYTLQHKGFENVFAFGDCINGATTRTQVAAYHQLPVIKHNLVNFLEGQELNGVYDGYTYFPMLLGTQYMTGFSHLWDYEPTP